MPDPEDPTLTNPFVPPAGPDLIPEPIDNVITEASKVLDDARQVIADVGLRPYRTFFVLETFAARVGVGGVISREWAEILPPPRVRPSQPWAGSPAGYQVEGQMRVDRVKRTDYRIEDLKGQTLWGDHLPKNKRFVFGVLAAGQMLAELYQMAAEPELQNFGWAFRLNPINRRESYPGFHSTIAAFFGRTGDTEP